jgi:hypothetical protein
LSLISRASSQPPMEVHRRFVHAAGIRIQVAKLTECLGLTATVVRLPRCAERCVEAGARLYGSSRALDALALDQLHSSLRAITEDHSHCEHERCKVEAEFDGPRSSSAAHTSARGVLTRWCNRPATRRDDRQSRDCRDPGSQAP